MREIDYFENLGVDRTEILQRMLKKKWKALNQVQLAVRQGPLVESCEHGNAREGSINGRTLPDLPSDCYLAVLSVDTRTTASV